MDVDAFVGKLRARLERLQARMALFSPFLEKELRGGHPLEAIDIYRGLVLDSLIEVLRMKHGPAHFEFRSRYVHEELPEDVVARLQRLAFVPGEDDLPGKAAEAIAWFREIAQEIDPSIVRGRLAASAEMA